jgi:hypothetical protein
MRKALLVAAGLVLGTVAAGAQGTQLSSPICPGGAATSQQQIAQDACQQASDLYQFLAPQLAAAIAGGNATLGQGSTLGGFGHFSIGLRVNAVQGAYPEVNLYTQSSTGAQRRTLQTKDSFIPFPTADAAVGIFGGIPLGVTNVAAIDALVSATYVPSYSADNFAVTPEQNLQLGYGARVGILQESIVVPGVAVTWLKRDLPTTSLKGTSGNNQLNINKLNVKTTSWRIVASKSLTILGFVVGAGQDEFDNSADINAVVSNVPVVGTAQSSIAGTAQKLTRTNYFADVSLNLPLFKIVAEAGQSSGGSISTYNSFSGGASDRSLTYFSAGIRFGF